jgi:hypothetical protein
MEKQKENFGEKFSFCYWVQAEFFATPSTERRDTTRRAVREGIFLQLLRSQVKKTCEHFNGKVSLFLSPRRACCLASGTAEKIKMSFSSFALKRGAE